MAAAARRGVLYAGACLAPRPPLSARIPPSSQLELVDLQPHPVAARLERCVAVADYRAQQSAQPGRPDNLYTRVSPEPTGRLVASKG